jgi:putative heme-binding domain-containing protein
MAAADDSLGSLETRARSYLHANCAACHRHNGGGSAPLWLNLEAPLKEASLLGAKPVQGDLGLPDARVIAPGDPARSVLLYRLASEGRAHMPYLGSKIVDERGLLLVRDWIAGLSRDNDEVAPVTVAQRDRERESLRALRRGEIAALAPLLATGSGALSVMLDLLDRRLPAAVRSAAIAQGAAIADPLRRDLFERFLPKAQRREVLGANFKPEQILARGGDAARGRAVFATACVACHRADGAGIDFGPDLSRIGAKYDRAALLEHIVAPNALVDPAWQLVTVALRDGNAKSGFVVTRDGAALALKVAGGAVEKIPAAQVARTTSTRTSLMPEGVLGNLTAAEAADLLAFLAALK